MILNGKAYSNVLEKDTSISIVVPDKYESNYKVVYLLHPLTGSNTSWLYNSKVTEYSNKYNVLIVMPDCDRSFYVNMVHGLRYYDYISNELPGIINATYNVSSNKEDIAIIGASMGGYGALRTALNNPDKYGFAGGIAPALLYFEEELNRRIDNKKITDKMYGVQMIKDYYNCFGEDLRYDVSNDLVALSDNVASLDIKPRVFITCGKNDAIIKYVSRFDEEMKHKDIDYTGFITEGIHDWKFFDLGLKKALEAFVNNQ